MGKTNNPIISPLMYFLGYDNGYERPSLLTVFNDDFAPRLYKQSTEGNIKVARPHVIDVVGGAKWDSWKAVEGANKAAAMHAYIEVTKVMMFVHTVKVSFCST